jgi:hypothetical protein
MTAGSCDGASTSPRDSARTSRARSKAASSRLAQRSRRRVPVASKNRTDHISVTEPSALRCSRASTVGARRLRAIAVHPGLEVGRPDSEAAALAVDLVDPARRAARHCRSRGESCARSSARVARPRRSSGTRMAARSRRRRRTRAALPWGPLLLKSTEDAGWPPPATRPRGRPGTRPDRVSGPSSRPSATGEDQRRKQEAPHLQGPRVKPTAGLEPATPSLRAFAGPGTWGTSRA